MHEAPLMQCAETLSDAGEYRDEISRRAAAPGTQIAAAGVFEDRKAGIGVDRAVAGKYVRMVQVCLQAGGVEKSCTQRGLPRQIRRQDLQRNVTVPIVLAGEPYLAPSARTKSAQQCEPRSQNLPVLEHSSPGLEDQGRVAPGGSAPAAVELVAAGSPVSFS